MRPTRSHVAWIAVAAEYRLMRLDQLATGIGTPLLPADRRTLSFVTIEAANLWAQFSRCLYLSAAFGARDPAGTPAVATPAASEEDAIDLAVYAVRPHLRGLKQAWTRRELPDFQNKGHLTKALQYVGATIFTDVETAVSYKSRVLWDLPTMRNFYAHKSREAALAAARLAPHYGITRRLAPSELLCSVPPMAGDILLREWLADLRAILGMMPH